RPGTSRRQRARRGRLACGGAGGARGGAQRHPPDGCKRDAGMSGKVVSAADAVARIRDGAVVTVSSSSALGCPDLVLKALGERFRAEGAPRGITALHPIAAGDMYGVRGMDHLAQDGLLSRVLSGSY